jgi:hypothetical protein
VEAPDLTRMELAPLDQWRLARFSRRTGHHLKAVFFIGNDDGRAFYRISDGAIRDCYGVGDDHAGPFRLGQFACSSNFPSSHQPVLDFTVMHGRGRVWRCEGIAANGIATVAFKTAKGDLIDSTPVDDNIYHVKRPPKSPVRFLLALDRRGAVVWRILLW